MITELTHKRFAAAPLLLVGVMVLTGCKWDNSEDYQIRSEQTGTEDSIETGDETSNDGSGTPIDNTDPVVSGVAATSEPLENANVCLDINDNAQCDEGEPSTTTDSRGEWIIRLPDGRLTTSTRVIVTTTDETRLADSGEIATWNFPLFGWAIPNGTDTVSGVFVSPISTLVENEINRLPSGDRDEAIRNVASKLGTTVNILENYLNPPAGLTPTEQDEYQRLERIAEVVNELAIEIDRNIPDEDRASLTPDELGNLIFDQINDGLEQVVEDVNRSLIETPDNRDFDGETVIQQTVYDELKAAPEISAPSPTLTELETRIANAQNNSPFFEKSGFETYPVNGAQTIDLHFFRNPLISTLNARRAQLHDLEVELANLQNTPEPPAPSMRDTNQIYYEARRRIAVDTELDAAIVDIQIAVPRNNDFRSDATSFQIISETICTDGDFQCDELMSKPGRVRALVWSGFSFREQTIQTGHAGQQRYLPLFELGDIVANSQSTQFSSEMNFREFSLDGLDARDVIEELVGGESVPGTNSFTFGSEAKAYTFSEALVAEIVLSTWPAGGTGNLCDAPGLPDASVTGSCNLVYGRIGTTTGQPAQTFADALYPVAQQNSDYTSLLENGKPVDALAISGPTDDVFVARLFGSASNDDGIIKLYRQSELGDWETLQLTGRWERSQEASFERIDLHLPAGFHYSDAKLGFELGHAYLFERDGYLRHGWVVPETVNVDSLFNRKQVRYAFNQEAFNQIITELNRLGLLTEHPYYTRQLIEDVEAAIQQTQEQIDNINSPGGSGGQTE
ncbi:hypothetical protein BTO32_15110 [Marinobacter lutaoensis]|uniref:Uncharacterized protein n=1 Tax=Marinobacter lutaoensis TaxID=135739 RepID=A0A1V2DPJ1_9GAMM|nr:hypothetical protein [Marinobacter lutaoensis]ONF42537.1 hypothetical protein BTO32_15110 [Marinobacter lutaoensis]